MDNNQNRNYELYFSMVESSSEEAMPFAFVATYTVLSNGKYKHVPLKNLLKESKEKKIEFEKITQILYKISSKSFFIRDLIKSGDIFSPIFFSVDDAYNFLREISLYEKYGVKCRIPNWWRNENTASLEIDLDCAFRTFGESALVNTAPEMIYNGIKITKEEIDDLLIKTEGLACIKGKWVEVDKRKLNILLDSFEEFGGDGTTFKELAKIIRKNKLRDNSIDIKLKNIDLVKEKNRFFKEDELTVPSDFNGKLRPYQQDGFMWLANMIYENYGVCLADDMGLGKTIQIIAFLLFYRAHTNKKVLLIVPSSLIYNWESEIRKFAPTLNFNIVRSKNSNVLMIDNSFLTITSYNIAQKFDAFYKTDWGVVILDEAQAIKNPRAKTSMKLKTLKRDASIALTGTPIENNLLNLWSLFDFINPGLLGSEKEFRDNYCLTHISQEESEILNYIINPFMLRRLKTDKSVIKDLPNIIENEMLVKLTKKQIILYKSISESLIENKISEENQFTQKRKIITAILYLKQICNHPSQFLGDDEYSINDSGKFIMLRDLCEIIKEREEKVLVFSQYKEIAQPLSRLLEEVFGKKGIIINGDVPVKEREKLIDKFQTTDIPYMVLTLKVAGVGLNLTSANNVIHFDRWWNPAVEKQATDRTYRIGQTKNVNVYKFKTIDTIEEIISHLLSLKTELSESVLENLDNNVLNKFTNEELLDFMQFRGDEDEE